MRANLLTAAIAAALSLTGCASLPFLVQRSGTITDQALEFNEAAALSDRQLILLNILRARDWESLSFTRLTMFRNLSTRQIQGGVNAGIGEGPSNDTLSPSLSVMGNHQPGFDLPVGHGQEFQRAIHSPVDLQLYQTFIEQGWQPGLIHMLLIERMTLSCAAIMHLRNRYTAARVNLGDDNSQERATYTRVLEHCGLENGQASPRVDAPAVTFFNYPSDWDAHQQFRIWLRILMANGAGYLRVCADTLQTPVGAPLDAGMTQNLAGVAAILGRENHTIRPVERGAAPPTQWQVARRDIERRFALGCPTDAAQRKQEAVLDINPVQVRSVEGVIYFLGELTRVREQHLQASPGTDDNVGVVRAPLIELGPVDGGLWRETLARAEADVFRVEEGVDASGVTIRHHGQNYTVRHRPLTCVEGAQCDGPGPDRSQQVIEFVLQLLNMSQNRADLPVTPTVNVAP